MSVDLKVSSLWRVTFNPGSNHGVAYVACDYGHPPLEVIIEEALRMRNREANRDLYDSSCITSVERVGKPWEALVGHVHYVAPEEEEEFAPEEEEE